MLVTHRPATTDWAFSRHWGLGGLHHGIQISMEDIWLATQRGPQNDGTATQNRVNYDIFCDLKGTPLVDMPPILASSQKIVGSESGKAE